MENENKNIKVIENGNNQSTMNYRSFASVFNKQSEIKVYFPKRTQGIFFPTIDGISLFEYIVGVLLEQKMLLRLPYVYMWEELAFSCSLNNIVY